MSNTGPILALVQIPADLLPAIEGNFGRVWSGRVEQVDQVADGPTAPSLSIVAGSEADVLRIAHAHDERAPGAVFVAVTDSARKIRRRKGGLPRNIAWAVAHEELQDARLLGVTLRYALEVAARRRLERDLSQLGALAEVGTVAAATAHEIGNPLTSVLTNLELLWSQVASDPSSPLDRRAVEAALGDALEGVRHIARVAGDLGRASARSGRVVTVDLSAVLDSAIRLASRGLRQVEVEVGGSRGLLVRADETRLCQVFLNLCQNASQAMGQTVGARLVIEVSREGEVVTVRFADNGPGVPRELAHRLFEPWVSGRGGSGLGLALSRRFLTEMGGSIERLDRSPGTTFDVRLTLARPASVPPTLVPDGSRARASVLVVDDNPLIGRALDRALGLTHHVEVVTTLEGGLERINGRWFDLVFLDLHLGDADGRHLYQQVAERSAAQARRIVFVSGGFEQEDLDFFEAQGVAWVRKPFGVAELRTLVAERLGGD